jgi:hypothetical protein
MEANKGSVALEEQASPLKNAFDFAASEATNHARK